MPELPEVEITARRLDEALRGVVVSSVLVPGLNALRTFDPPVSALEGRAIAKHDVGGDLGLVDAPVVAAEASRRDLRQQRARPAVLA